MRIDKNEILNKICYTELVYDRINKKLNCKYSNSEIEKMLYEIIHDSDENLFQKTGKNIYLTNSEHNLRLTINSNTYRIITVDKIDKLIDFNNGTK